MKKISIFIIGTLLISTSSFAVRCSDFKNHQEAQAYFVAKKPGYKRLDRDHDGSACDCLRGGTDKICPKGKKKHKSHRFE